MINVFVCITGSSVFHRQGQKEKEKEKEDGIPMLRRASEVRKKPLDGVRFSGPRRRQTLWLNGGPAARKNDETRGETSNGITGVERG